MTIEQELQESLRRYRIPEHMHQSVLNYILHGVHPGSFLESVLENNLLESVRRADDENLTALVQWVKFLYEEAPLMCWGSLEKIEAWMKARYQERIWGGISSHEVR